jgi:hypothetical protein
MPQGDAAELERYLSVLADAERFSNVVLWKPTASNWLRENLSNHTQKSIVGLLCQYRDQVRQRAETRDLWKDKYSYYYAFVLPIDGISVFIETVFDAGDTKDDSTIVVVNMHASNA